MVKKQWQIDIDGKPYEIQLEHSHLSGRKIIKVNGNLIHNSREILDTGGDYRFIIGDHICFVRIDTNGYVFSYDLIIDGVSIDTKKPVKQNLQANDEWERIKKIGRNKFLWYEGFFKKGTLFAMGYILLVAAFQSTRWNFDTFLQRALLFPILMIYRLLVNWNMWHTLEKKFNK